jgi:RNA-directed DNA polymerase
MRRAGGLLARIADPDNLELAFVRARRGKQDRYAVRRYADDLHARLAELRQDLLAGTCELHGYRCFSIRDPKPRLIAAPAFADRVLHHAILQVLEPELERVADFDSYACRKGKGLHKAIARAQSLCRRHEWFLQLDVRKFFDSIDHAAICELLRRRVKDLPLLQLLGRIVGSYETGPGIGLPIGSLTSQHLANFYLHPLDRFVRADPAALGYVRYMDDFVVFGNCREALAALRGRVGAFLYATLRLGLKNAGSLDRTSNGVGFLGLLVRGSHVRLMSKTKRRMRRKWRILLADADAGRIAPAELAMRSTALLARTRQVKARGLRARWTEDFGCRDL